jgi:general stress protein CsbA
MSEQQRRFLRHNQSSQRMQATGRNEEKFMAITANRYLALLLLFIAAAISYAVGFMAGFWLLIVIGAVFELMLWGKLIFGRRRR